MIAIYKLNLEHLVKVLESKFDTIVNSFGILRKEDIEVNQIVNFLPSYHFSYIGYLLIPVDEDGEYVITNTNTDGLDGSSIMDRFALIDNLHSISDIIDFMEGEFGCKIYFGKKLKVNDAINKSKLIPHMDDENKFLFLYYILK